MDIFSNIKALFDIIDSIYKELSELRHTDVEKVEQIYSTIIEPSFQNLNKIHDDYTINISSLIDHLQDHSHPPRDLLIWLRDAGLKYRSVRENLWTIDTDLKSLDTKQFTGVKKRHAQFLEIYCRYLRSIIEYYRCTVSCYGLSIYRNSDSILRAVLDAVGDDDTTDGETHGQFKKFYEHSTVTDFSQELMTICDVRLPQYWQAVCRNYREVRMCAIGDKALFNNKTH